MPHDYSDALLDIHRGIATITLNRPEVLNAFSPKMEDDLVAALDEIRDRHDVRVVVVTGQGRGFCSGADVSAWSARLASEGSGSSSPIDGWRRRGVRAGLFSGIMELEQPVIASVNGAAVGMGMEIALACDMRIASERAKFSMLYIKRAQVPTEGGAWLLARLLGLPRAFELTLTGDFVEGPEAERIGLVNHCVPDHELLDATEALARKIADGPPVASALAKRAIRDAWSLDYRGHLDQVAYFSSITAGSDDVAEGVRSFMEGREPRFTGR